MTAELATLPKPLFAGDGEMARRVRELDWASTPLGPIASWPQALRTSVDLCLECGFPIVVWWGAELTVLYNDEYLPLMGSVKHPRALGQPGRVVWPEIWDTIGPMLAQVMEQGKATRSRDFELHIAREGYPEETYWSFSYSPIHDDHGDIAGVFCPVIETTDNVVGQRRLASLRDLAQCKGAETERAVYEAAGRALGANPRDLPFALLYRLSGDGATAELDTAVGIEAGEGAAAPARIVLGADDDVWRLGDVARSGKAATLTDLTARFGALPMGAWPAPPHTAVLLPIQTPGQERPSAILVAAVNPLNSLDDAYRTWLGLVATQIASGLADAQALQAERERAAALAEIDRAKTAFFSNVSHEFRTPLTLLLGPLEELLTDGALPADVAATLTLVQRNGQRLQKLVNSLLDFARIEAGRVEAVYEPTDLAADTAELAGVFRSAVEHAGLRLVVDCEPLAAPAFVDRDMWEKIVLNLVSNAFKFTFEGEIRVALRSHGDRIELQVSDTGVGIAAVDVPKLFQRFHRVRNARSRTHEGSGIGLALVRELARLHGGDVAVESREGVGSTFTVSIPAGKDHLPAERIGATRQLVSTRLGAAPFLEEASRAFPAERAQPSAAPAFAAPLERPRARIVLADDNVDMRDYVRRLLERDYDVVAVADGQAALDSIRGEPPDLVLTDVMMPRLDGFGLVAAVRADERIRAVPVIMLSARAGEEARIEGLGAGADDYLIKPFSARELLARVGSQIALAGLRSQHERALRDADRRKDEFLATLAHELRTPLAPIHNALQILRLAGRDGVVARNVHDMMERQVNHMVRLVEDLMEVSRITRGKIDLRKQRVELAAVIGGAVETTRPLIDAAGHSLKVDLGGEPLELDGDPVRLAQVFGNLLNNAAKYTPNGGQITVRAERRGAAVVVSVRDNGAGIRADVLDTVFELFVQAERTYNRAQGGLGIGLTLARSIVTLHGGTVEALSAGPGLGSEFVVRLPLLQPVSVAAAAVKSKPATRIAGQRILVVDDNVDAAETLSALLRCLGADVVTVHDGPAALEYVRTHKPSVAVLDIGMPGMDGYEVARRARATPGGGDLTLIALTGWGNEEDRRRSREAGIDHHLVKPVDLSVLEDLLAARQVAALSA